MNYTTTPALYSLTILYQDVSAPTPSPPTWSNLGHNSTDIGSVCKFYAKWTDPDGLKGYIFSWNGTGSWTNSTWTPFSGIMAWSNATRVLPSTNGMKIGHRFYANETNKGWNSTSVDVFITTKPQGWEETVLTLTFPDAANSTSPPPEGATVLVKGTLSYSSNGTRISGAWLKVYVGFGDEFSLAGMARTDTVKAGEYTFSLTSPIRRGASDITSVQVKWSIRVMYMSDRPWTLGSSVQRTVTW